MRKEVLLILGYCLIIASAAPATSTKDKANAEKIFKRDVDTFYVYDDNISELGERLGFDYVFNLLTYVTKNVVSTISTSLDKYLQQNHKTLDDLKDLQLPKKNRKKRDLYDNYMAADSEIEERYGPFFGLYKFAGIYGPDIIKNAFDSMNQKPPPPPPPPPSKPPSIPITPSPPVKVITVTRPASGNLLTSIFGAINGNPDLYGGLFI